MWKLLLVLLACGMPFVPGCLEPSEPTGTVPGGLLEGVHIVFMGWTGSEDTWGVGILKNQGNTRAFDISVYLRCDVAPDTVTVEAPNLGPGESRTFEVPHHMPCFRPEVIGFRWSFVGG